MTLLVQVARPPLARHRVIRCRWEAESRIGRTPLAADSGLCSLERFR